MSKTTLHTENLFKAKAFRPNPIQNGILETIQAFRNFQGPSKTIGAFSKETGRGTGGYGYIRDLQCLDFRLPRRSGSTELCHYLIYKWQCPLVVRHYEEVDQACKRHKELYNEEAIIVAPIHLEAFGKFGDPAKEMREKFHDAVKASRVVVFDVFRAYCDFDVIKKLIRELHDCQFIMFQ